MRGGIGVNLSSCATKVCAEQRCRQTGTRLLPSLIGRCSSRTACACRSVCFLLPTSSLCYRDSSSKNKLQAGSQLASLPTLPAKATRPSLSQHSLMCESAVNSSPVPSIQVAQILAFIAVCCYLFSCLIYCFTLLVAFSFNGFVWPAANLLCSDQRFSCMLAIQEGFPDQLSLVNSVGDRVKECSKR